MSLPDLLVLSLATFYAAYALCNTKGPFGYFKWLRDNVMHGGLLECIYCAAFWLAVVFIILWISPAQIVVYPFAGAGAGMLLYRYTGGSVNV